MAIHVYRIPTPHLYLSLQSGGDLPANTTFYFIGFFFRGSGYYGISASPGSKEVSITTDDTNKTIQVEWWQDGGDVSSFTDNGSGGTTVHATAHGRSDGDSVDIRGTTNYDGTYTISNVTTDTFDISTAYVADETGEWFADKGNPHPSWAAENDFTRFGLKWDYYSMLKADGTPYRWNNLNNPNKTSEFDNGYGHLRWTVRYYNFGDGYYYGLNGSNTITKVCDAYSGSTWTGHELYDGESDSTMRGRVNSRIHVIDLAFQDDPAYCALNSHFARDKGQLLIYFDDTDTNNTTSYLVKALVDSGYSDQYWVDFESNSGWGYNDGEWVIEILGSFYSKYADVSIDLSDATITLWQGEFFNNGYSSSAGKADKVANRSKLIQKSIGWSMWSNIYINLTDTSLLNLGNAFILDNGIYDNATIKPYGGSTTFYMKSAGGVTIPGGYHGGTSFMQWRYQRDHWNGEVSTNPDDWAIVNNVTSHLFNCTFKGIYIYYVENGASNDGYMDNIAFYNDGLQGYDVNLQYNYADDNIDEKMICRNVTSNRSDGKVKLYISSLPSSYTVKDEWDFYFGVDLTLVDEDGNPIENATLKIDWGTGSETATTDSDGKAKVYGLSYYGTYDSVAEGNHVYMQMSDFTTNTVTITKSGYESYSWKGTLKEGKEWTVTLKKSKSLLFDTNTNVYFNLDKENSGKTVSLQKI